MSTSLGCNPGTDAELHGSIGATRQDLSSCIDVADVGDATLEHPPMNKNSGAEPILRVGGEREALLQFDLRAIPAGASIDRATLTMTVAGGDDRDDDDDGTCERDGEARHHCPTINLHRATAVWSENTVTFASFAQHFAADLAGSFSVTSRHMAKAVDLTPLVTAWLSAAKPNDGILLESKSKQGTTFVSRDGSRAEQRPSLQVCFTTVDNHCAPSPCQNGAACTNDSNGYVCACAPGYTGKNCETVFDNCASSPCTNGGACSTGVNTYSCSCAAGFSGRNCEVNVDDCAGSPCQNGGVCQDGVASYTCHCAPGYAGANCETLVNNCASAPCQNGGTCANGLASYTCACAVGFTGLNCEVNVDDCVATACQNGGTCIDGVNSYSCACPPDWGGAHCEVNLNDCTQNPCLNGATCKSGLGSYICSCAPGYSGTNCQTDIDDCAVNACQNGSVCVDGVNSYTCVCANGASGAHCELAPVVTVPWVPGQPTLPHPVLSGKPTTLKGVALAGATQYLWDFGDGSSPSLWLPIVAPYNLGISHTYTGPPGVLYFARLSVRIGSGGAAYTAVYPVQIADPSALPDPRIATAVDDGLWYLHTRLARSTFPAGAPGYGLPTGTFTPLSSTPVGDGCAAAEAFERHGSKPTGAASVDPYADDVARLLNETFATMNVSSVFAPYDGNGNQKGLSFAAQNSTHEWGACSQALVLGFPASYVLPAGPNGVYGRTLADVSQDVVDFIGSTQPQGLAVWWPDGHGTIWATLALSNFEKLGAVVAPSVRPALASWLTSTRDTGALCGGSGAYGANDGIDITATAGALFEEHFLGVSPSDPTVPAGLGFLYRYWSGAPTSLCAIANGSMTAYAIQLALRTSSTSSLANYACDGSGGTTTFDWFADPNKPGMASTLFETQTADGHWSDDPNQGVCWAQSDTRATAWNVSTLIGGGFSRPSPVVCDCANLTFGTNQTISLDGSCSFTSDSTRTISSYEWDFNYRGNEATFNPQATGTRVTDPGYAAYGTYPVALRVTDDSPTGPVQAVAVCNVTLTPPPHCPIPNAGGAGLHRYHAALNVPIQLDASLSFDADSDPLTFAWDFFGSGQFTDATGSTVSRTYSAPGTYAVAVRVTDHPELNVIPYAAPDCSRVGYATVVVGSP